MRTCLALTPTPLVGSACLWAGHLMHGIRRAAELGYDGVELHVRDANDIDADAVLRAVEIHGLAIAAVVADQMWSVDSLSLLSPARMLRARIRDRLLAHIVLAARLHAPLVIGAEGPLGGDDLQRRATAARVAESLRDIARAAEVAGVTIAIEPLNRYESGLVRTVEDALTLIETVAADNLRIALDTFHGCMEESNLVRAIERAGWRLAHVQLADCNRRAPGDGHLDVAPILAALARGGYAGFVSAEIQPVPDDETAATAFIARVGGHLRSAPASAEQA